MSFEKIKSIHDITPKRIQEEAERGLLSQEMSDLLTGYFFSDMKDLLTFERLKELKDEGKISAGDLCAYVEQAVYLNEMTPELDAELAQLGPMELASAYLDRELPLLEYLRREDAWYAQFRRPRLRVPNVLKTALDFLSDKVFR